MIITKDKIVSIEYTLKDKDGEVLDSSEDLGVLEYLHGYENLIPGLEKELEGKKEGDIFSVTVEPSVGYGEFSQELIVDIPRANFDEGAPIEVGMQFEAGSADGSRIVKVTKVEGDTVTIDANHELAGKTLFFDVTVSTVRDATEDEIKSGITGGGCGCGSGGGGCGSGDTGGGCGSGGCGSGGCGSGSCG